MINDGFQHLDLRLQRIRRSTSIRESAAEFIIADDGVVPRQVLAERSYCRLFPLQFEVTNPSRRNHECGAASDSSIRDTRTVSRRAKVNRLIHKRSPKPGGVRELHAHKESAAIPYP